MRALRRIVWVVSYVSFALAGSGPATAYFDVRVPVDEPKFHGYVRVTQPDGRQLVGGSMARSYNTFPFGTYAFAVESLKSDGSIDATFNGTGVAEIPVWGFYEFVSALLVQPDGKIIAGGNTASPRTKEDAYVCYPADCRSFIAVVRLNPDGTLDRSFNRTGRLVMEIGDGNRESLQDYGILTGLTLQPDGKIVVLGGRTPVARVNADGTLDRTFVGTSQVAQEIAVTDDLPAIGSGHTGSWYNPAQSGHGFMLEVLPGDPMRLLAGWFTFAPQGGPSWIVGVGPIDGNRAVLRGYQMIGSGGHFPPNFDPANVHQESWGTLTFSFGGCDHGRVDWWSTTPGYGSGAMDLTRLTLPAGLTCSPASSASH